MAETRGPAPLFPELEDARTHAMRARDEGATFFVNDSGGKDSRAQLIEVSRHVPAEQIVVVHASLGRSEWPGALEQAQQHAADLGVPFLVARSATHPDLLSMVRKRHRDRPEVPSWPSATTRQCTSDLKRGPIEREIRRYTKANGITKIVNTLGLRAAESSGRAKACQFKVNAAQSVAGRQWLEWLPIHGMSTADVFRTVEAAGRELHPAYACGNERLSCVFCIMASRNDLRNGALNNPELYREYVEVERETGYTMHMSRKSLPELTGVTV